MLSTISYLAWPGELIKHGPMMLAIIAGLPPVYFLAGWFLIPRIMKLKITSANELLEARLGVGVRTLGAVFFLAMRLAWMAVIIFATTDKILVPLLGLDPSMTPPVCALLGMITVIYTAMGGLRAVVVTDVTQTLILFGGAILTLVLISVRLGGVTAWWPTEWPNHWQEPVWGFSSTARVTFLGAALAQFTWWICTAGSDQMAIQRYLATRDAKAARGVLLTSLVANVLVALILCTAGLALLAFFSTRPDLLKPGQDLLSDADKLFPRFVEVGMPAGISGLVVAGLLAAAMSSLSSGVNSSSSIITVDFIDRFRSRRNGDTETDHVKLARIISVFVGLVVIGLASGVGMVHGNLLEVAFKVVNLLTAPLFGLFFMAMFVRWATGPGTMIGAAFGVLVVVEINYWKEFTGTEGISFLWAMPLAFLVQVTVGALASLLRIGRRGAQERVRENEKSTNARG
jgi:SSS family solute:Na+ symporter